MEQVAVLDASALIALLYGEPGADLVAELIPRSVISTVNVAEVAQAAALRGVSAGRDHTDIEALGITIVPFSAAQAQSAGAMHAITRPAGLSLADRACLALALELGAEAVTADKAWANLDLGVAVRQVR